MKRHELNTITTAIKARKSHLAHRIAYEHMAIDVKNALRKEHQELVESENTFIAEFKIES